MESLIYDNEHLFKGSFYNIESNNDLISLANSNDALFRYTVNLFSSYIPFEYISSILNLVTIDNAHIPNRKESDLSQSKLIDYSLDSHSGG